MIICCSSRHLHHSNLDLGAGLLEKVRGGDERFPSKNELFFRDLQKLQFSQTLGSTSTCRASSWLAGTRDGEGEVGAVVVISRARLGWAISSRVRMSLASRNSYARWGWQFPFSTECWDGRMGIRMLSSRVLVKMPIRHGQFASKCSEYC